MSRDRDKTIYYSDMSTMLIFACMAIAWQLATTNNMAQSIGLISHFKHIYVEYNIGLHITSSGIFPYKLISPA